VVETGNYEEDRPTGPNFNLLQTLIIDRRGNLKSCERLAEALGLPRDRIVQDVNDAYVLDVSLVIGKDYEYLSCWQAMENPYE
jgi:hypothetical protein